MGAGGTVLVVGRDLGDWGSVIQDLSHRGYRLLAVSDPCQVAPLSDRVDLVLCEEASDTDGAVLRRLRTAHPHVLRILVREAGATTPAVDGSMYQLVRKPLDTQEIGMVVTRALETRELGRRHRLLSRELKFRVDSPLLDRDPRPVESAPPHASFEKLVYTSQVLSDLCALARRAAATDLPVLILGETGTGKELLARAVHFHSARRASPLLVQNSAGMSDPLLHSELFGHQRGSFTGAVSDRLGLFRAADGGTVFLDEISEVTPTFQVSLLRFLQEGEVKPLGSDDVTTADVRIIAASNRSLADLVRRKVFREDLYFRLNAVELTIPPLRERPADIPVLAEFFVRKYASSLGRRIVGVAPDLVERLLTYPFPGNVRELENEIRRMVALAADGSWLTARLLKPAIAASRSVRAAPPPQGGRDTRSLKNRVEDLETAVVHDSLRRNGWNKTATARELGLSRVGLDNKIRRYELEP